MRSRGASTPAAPRSRGWAALAVLLLLAPGDRAALAGSEASPPADDPAAQAGAMLETLFDGLWTVARSSAPGPQKRDAIESRLADHLDYSSLARSVLGPRAESFSREEYADFAREYARYVTGLLVQRVADAEQPTKLVETRFDADKGVVRALALGRERRRIFRFQRNQPEGRSELHITLARAYGDWRVVGLRIDAIDSTRVFREQFDAVLDRADPAALIEELRRRNRENEGEDPFDASP